MTAQRRDRRTYSGVAVAVAACSAVWAGHQAISFVTGVARTGIPARQQLRSPAVAVAAGSEGAWLDAKAKLMDLLSDETLAQEILKAEGKPTKGRVDEAIVKLERFNPTEEPVYSDILDGTWKVKYAGAYAPGMLSSPTRELALFLYGGGFSLGNALTSFAQGFWGQTIGVKLGGKTVRIQGGRDVDASAEVEFFGRKDKLSYSAELMPLSPVRMSEEVVSMELPPPLGKQDVPLEMRRSILVTYLDQDTLIVRDETGVPEVLVKELEQVTPSTPSTLDESATDQVLMDAMSAEAS